MKASNDSSTRKSTADSSSSPRATFNLADANEALDPRTAAARRDLADIALAGRVFAPYFAEPRLLRVTAGVADLRETPSHEARLGSQLLHGEQFAELESQNGWSWGYGVHDHYVGYIETGELGAGVEPTHVVAARLTNVYGEPDSGARQIGEATMGQRFVAGRSGQFMAVEKGFIAADDLVSIDARTDDPVAIAERLIGTPYLWGGRSGLGIDCSGLVQLAHAFAGIAAPRDSDQQQLALGDPITEGKPLRRGDIFFFPNHVGMMRDGATLLHANHHHGETMAEPLADVIARIGREHPRPVLARRRVAV